MTEKSRVQIRTRWRRDCRLIGPKSTPIDGASSQLNRPGCHSVLARHASKGEPQRDESISLSATGPGSDATATVSANSAIDATAISAPVPTATPACVSACAVQSGAAAVPSAASGIATAELAGYL